MTASTGDSQAGELQLWLWEYTDDFGKRRRSTWLMTEETAKSYRDAVKVEGTLERRSGPRRQEYFRP